MPYFNEYYYSVQTLLFSRILSKKLRIKHVQQIVLYGCETWSLKVRKEGRQSILENSIMKLISGPKKDAIMEWMSLHIEVLHRLYLHLI
jgi:hypothetical protein